MYTFDVLVIGTGLAGLEVALKLADNASVCLLSKKKALETNTCYAQGGIASVISASDSFAAHYDDTIEAGAGLCKQPVVELVVKNGPARISELVDWGTKFDKTSNSSEFELAREGGHSNRRILHAGDATGAEIQRSLLEKCRLNKNITILEDHIAIDLIIRDGMRGKAEALGAYVLEQETGNVLSFAAKCTVLACGGVGKVYLYTSNSDVATGDGIAMAFRAGVRAANMEFIQFHPTCLYHPKAKSFLITEAMRGEGARLINPKGDEFMKNYHPKAELAPRDIVARAIDAEMKKTGADHVFLDISFKDPKFVMSRFPTIYRTTLEFGIDITKEPIPVVPAAHYCCGGIEVNLRGRTSIECLYAVGENACTGLHGANRLASNSLLEAAVFGHEVAMDILETIKTQRTPSQISEWSNLNTTDSPELVIISHLWDEVRRTMWNLVGIVRNDKRLAQAARRLRTFREEVLDFYWHYRVTSDLIELRNLVLVAEIIVESARRRRESRGLHFNTDCPEKDDANWLRDSLVEAKELNMQRQSVQS